MKPSVSQVLLALASATLLTAQTNPGPVTQASTVVVSETRLTADAAGATRVVFDEVAPHFVPSLESLSAHVANLHIDAGGAASFGDIVTLRGLANTPYFSDPSVTLYFDDLPLGSSYTYPTGLFGFSSATVARGPQGSAFGRGGEGGVISLVSTEPGATAGGELRASFGNYNARTAALTARSARGAMADATVSASAFRRDGFIYNTTLGANVDDQVSYAASARVRVRPAAGTEFTLQLLGSRHRDGAQPLAPLSGSRYTVARARDGSTEVDFGGVALKGAFDTSAGLLSATTSYTNWKLNPYDNRLTLPPTLDSKIIQTQRTWNEEIRLASAPKSEITWHAGAWFSDGLTNGDVNRGVVLPFGVVPAEVSSSEAKARTYAVFGDATFAPAAGWRLTAGLRAEHVTKDFDRSQRVPGPGRFVSSDSFDSFEPKLAAHYAINADTTASASVSLGAKPGGWSAYTANANLAAFRQEKATAYEVGVDTALAGKTIQLAARLFDYEIKDYQIERSFNASDYLVVNAPEARSAGGELEATWRPITAWTFTATVGITDVTLREFTDPFTKKSYAGNRAPYAPDYNAHLAATWHPGTGWFATAELDRTGKTFFDESENPAFAAKAHTVVNSRLGYETATWRISLYGENVFKEAYTAFIIPGVRHQAPGAPRQYGVEVAVKW